MKEKVIIPHLNTIEVCYVDTYKHYCMGAERYEQM